MRLGLDRFRSHSPALTQFSCPVIFVQKKLFGFVLGASATENHPTVHLRSASRGSLAATVQTSAVLSLETVPHEPIPPTEGPTQTTLHVRLYRRLKAVLYIEHTVQTNGTIMPPTELCENALLVEILFDLMLSSDFRRVSKNITSYWKITCCW